MALNFPPGPSVGDIYQRWVWNGISWVTAPTVAQPMLPIAGGTITGNLGVQGTTDLTGTLTAAGASNFNTMQVNGAANFLDGVTLDGVDSADLATRQYVDEAVASGGLWQGTWDASANNPDLTDPDLHMNGWGWTIVTPDPTAPFVVPATPAIPGVSGVTVYNGDHVIWSTAAAAFEIVHGSSLSLQEAQDMFVAKAGDTMTGALTVTGGAINANAGLNVTGNLVVNGAIVNPIAAGASTMSAAGAGTNWANPLIFAIPVDFATRDVGVFNLQSTDMIAIWYSLRFDLANLTPGVRKEVLLNMSNLFRPTFRTHPFPGQAGSNRMQQFSAAVGIFEAGVGNFDWIGRDQPMMTDGWFSEHQLSRTLEASWKSWRSRWGNMGSAGDGFVILNRVRAMLQGSPAFNQHYDQVRNRWLGGTWRQWQSAVTEGPAALHVQFDYFGPNSKLMAFTPYYRMPRGNT